jgi:hypothetical protein
MALSEYDYLVFNGSIYCISKDNQITMLNVFAMTTMNVFLQSFKKSGFTRSFFLNKGVTNISKE